MAGGRTTERRPARRPALALALGTLALMLLFALPSAAATPKKTALIVEASPVLGASTPTCPGWFSIEVRLSNSSDAQITGTLELVSELAYSRNTAHIVTRAPFGVAGKGRVTLELPTHGFNGSVPELRLRALDPDGNVLADVGLPDPRPHGPFLFDLDVPSRLAPSLRGQGVITTRTSSVRYGTYPTLAVSTPEVNPSTGDPVLPERAAGYASATVVLAKSEQIAALKGPELRALGDWVLAGGALAVVVTRPEDLHRPPLVDLLGGEVAAGAPTAGIRAERDFLVVPDPSARPPYTYRGPGTGRTAHKLLTPSSDVAEKLVGYRGGNLHPSPWGASASYGLGEVHLLAFDATHTPYVTDEWVQLEMLDLVTHAFNRENTVALPYAQTALDRPGVRAVKKVLDPNEGSRWAIAISALLLLVYAAGAGPLNFYRASRKGRPLKALLHLPIWAAGAFGMVVVLGVAAKGVSGRARHLTLVEAGAGMSRAAATRFRGFYSASSGQLTVRATQRGAVLDVAGRTDDTGREVVVDRDGARIEHFQAKPWQTVVVREDGFIDLGGGISIVRTGHDVEVKNRTARDLLAVLLKVPGKGVVYFPRIADGQSRLASKGKVVPGRIGHPRVTGPTMTHGLDADLFDLDEAAEGAGAAWQALETLAARDTDWWPTDAPLLLGQLAGGEGRSSDSGLQLDRDRVLVRVVGYGGVK